MFFDSASKIEEAFMSMMDKGKEVFREEAKELLTELETSLLELEDDPGNSDLISRVFRAMHTIKGSGSMFGYDAMAKFTHEIETAFDQVRSGKVVMTKDLVSISLDARDLIKSMLESPDDGAGPEHSAQASTIHARLREIMPIAEQQIKNDSDTDARTATASGEAVTYRIFIKPDRNVFKTGNSPAAMVEDLASMGECTVVANTDDVPLMKDMDPELCYTAWNVTLTTDRGMKAIQDVFIFVQNDAEIRIELLGTTEEAGQKKFGEILVERGATTPAAINDALLKQKRLGDILQETGGVNASDVEAALSEQQHLKEISAKKQCEDSTMSVRVAADKLDRLVDLVGELVTVQARFSQAAGERRHRQTPFRSISEEVERLTAELRDNAMSIRMMPIGSTFSKFKRLVRDLTKELGKEIELTTDGAETELDKTVIEKLNDPLVHLIRNSIDHGVEMPAVRETNGKSRGGVVHLSAKHSGAQVLITVEDDGAGLDPERIRAKAVEKGLISADATLSEKEIFALILLPGFSTAKTVTSVSGRGVGMDVVKRSIDSLRGTIEIKSKKGIGSSITLHLPLTLAIIEGLMVKISNDYFIIPLSHVEECVELTRKDVANSHGRDMANVRGKIVPYIRLRERFSFITDRPDREQIVITRSGDYRVGLVVDGVIGNHQTVIKPLGSMYKHVEGLSGATILGDGSVALILDVAKLVQMVEQKETMVMFDA
jgi:two-component system chemotaxis sensor kinase CheA